MYIVTVGKVKPRRVFVNNYEYNYRESNLITSRIFYFISFDYCN